MRKFVKKMCEIFTQENDTNVSSDNKWMNPESDKYYKGFRYKKQKHHESWYDENNVIRKRIYNTYEKITYFNNKGERHNEDGAAYTHRLTDGNIYDEKYFINGIHLTKTQWLIYTGKDFDNYDVIETTDSSKTFQHKETGNYIKFVLGDTQPEAIFYYNKDKKLHRKDGYASIIYENKQITSHKYFLNDVEVTEEEMINYKHENIIKKLSQI